MRYIGNKANIVEKIFFILKSNQVEGDSFFDFFSGTASVACFFKIQGYKVFSSDVMYLSYCLQKAYIENNQEPEFEKLLPTLHVNHSLSLFPTRLELVCDFLSSIAPVKGFVYLNYAPSGTASLPQPRMYFSDENAGKIDAVRQQIEVWKNDGLLSEHEYYILLACLLETTSLYANVAGVYGAFGKKWDPRALKRFWLRPVKILNNGRENVAYNVDSMTLLPKIDADIFYLDPPYNERQYLPNYHLLETIAKYDSPAIHGTTGMRNYSNERSSFCNAKTALQDLDLIAKTAQCRHLVLSYNSEGIVAQQDILDTLSKYGKVKFEQFEYARFKSNNNGLSKTKKTIFEQLYILSK